MLLAGSVSGTLDNVYFDRTCYEFVHHAFMQKYVGRGPVEFIPSGETKQRILFLVCHSYMLYLAHISDPLL